MNTNKYNLDLRFLYQEPLIRDSMIAGRDLEQEAWDEKYEKGEYAFRDFSMQCTLDEFVYMYIYIFKEKFPNVIRLAFTIAETYADTNNNTSSFIKFERNDIISFVTEDYKGPIKNELIPENRDVYETEIALQFSKSFSLSVIDEALEGVVFTKSTTSEITTYLVENSPIAKLEVTSKSFTIYVNKEKIYLYYKW